MVIRKYYIYFCYGMIYDMVEGHKPMLLYVGKTKQKPKSRWLQHRNNPEELWTKEVDSVYYAECNSETDMFMYEVYYINKLKPLWNKALVFNQEPTVELPELEFKALNIRGIDTPEKLEQFIMEQIKKYPRAALDIALRGKHGEERERMREVFCKALVDLGIEP